MSDQNNLVVAGEAKQVMELQFRADSLRGFLSGAREHLELIACEEIRNMDEAHKARFFEKTALAIVGDEKLKACFESVEGKLSIKSTMEFAVETGLIPGEDFYPIPYKKKVKKDGQDVQVSIVEVIEREEGLRKLALGGKKPLMKKLEHFAIYQADTAYNEKKGIPLVDGKAGVINYYPAIANKAPETLLGFAIAHVMADGERGANFIPLDRVLTARNHSASYKDYLKSLDEWEKLERGEVPGAKKETWSNGTVVWKAMRYNSYKRQDEMTTIYKPEPTVWDTDFVRKCEIAALKIYLKPWIRVREAVGDAMYGDGAPVKKSMESVVAAGAETWAEVDDEELVHDDLDDEPGPEVTGIEPDGTDDKKPEASVNPAELF